MSEYKWFVGIFDTDNGQRIGISEYYDDEELEQIKNGEILREQILISGLTEQEADQECRRLVEELNIPMFDNHYDSY